MTQSVSPVWDDACLAACLCALAPALEGASAPTAAHLRRIAPAALRHRLRRNVLDDAASTIRVERAVDEVLLK